MGTLCRRLVVKTVAFRGKAAHFLNVTPAHPASKPLENGDVEAPGGNQIWKKITVLLSPSGTIWHHLDRIWSSLPEVSLP